MTLDELLALARVVRETPWARLPADQATRLAIGVIDLLAEAVPCGFEEPELAPAIAKPTLLSVPESWAGWVDPETGRALGRMLFRAADEAEGP